MTCSYLGRNDFGFRCHLMFENLRSRARVLKNETVSLYLATKDPRTPWYVKAIVFITVAYALSPIDLIPDFVPILGYLDDLIIVHAGIALAIRLIPAEVLEEAQNKVSGSGLERSVGYIGTGFILILWFVVLVGVIRLIRFLS